MLTPSSTPSIAPSSMRAMVVCADGRGVEEAVLSVPLCPPEGALLALRACGLCGSDVEKLRYGKAQPGQVLGHEWVGTVQALGPNAPTTLTVGQRVALAHHVPCGSCGYCRHDAESMCAQFKATNIQPGGFASVIAVSGQHLASTVFAVPQSVSDAQASTLEPLACVLKGVRRSGVHAGDTVLIQGLGYIGLLAAQCYRLLGVRVVGVETRPDRLLWARQQGWLDDGYLPEELPAEPLLVDAVFNTFVTQPSLDTALQQVRNGGTVVLFSRGFGAADPVLNASALYFRQIAVVPSYSPALSDLQQAARYLFAGRIAGEPLVSHTMPLSQLQQGLQAYQQGLALKVLLTAEDGLM
ncbi:MAG: alcohol dehydrogenase catalytic domain-containing protein [Vampirovibrionales bacterium]